MIRSIDLDGLEKVVLSGTVPNEQYYAGDGRDNTGRTYYTPTHIKFFKQQGERLKKQYGFEAFQVSTGKDIVNKLKEEYRYGFNGFEKDDEVKGEGNSYTAAFWEYDPRLGRRWNADPLAHKFPWQSPYVAFDNNPINKIDPDGRAAYSPIYGTDGKFLGTDDHGLQGKAIVMKQEDFKQGMRNEDAMKKDLAPNGGVEYYKAIPDWANYYDFYNHYNNLPNRPDYDGFVNIREGIDWAKSHPGALENSSPDNMLYMDVSKLKFGNITIGDFRNGVGQSSPINLNTKGNFAEARFNYKLASTVYAYGRVDVTLLNNRGSVKIVNDFNLPSNRATDYDWNKGGSIWRKGLINYERWSEDLNDTHGFRVFYYGTGKLRP